MGILPNGQNQRARIITEGSIENITTMLEPSWRDIGFWKTIEMYTMQRHILNQDFPPKIEVATLEKSKPSLNMS